MKKVIWLICIFVIGTALSGCTSLQHEKVPSQVATAPSVETSALVQTKDQPNALTMNDFKPDDQELTHDQKNMISPNGQLFHKNNNKVYYVNVATQNLYVFDLVGKSARELPIGISNRFYMDGDWVYFYNFEGIYKIKTDGTNKVKLSSDRTNQLWVKNEKIYYTQQIGFDSINGTPQGDLYQMGLDGTSKKKFLTDNIKHYFLIDGEWLYYVKLSDRSINKIKLDGTSKTLLTAAKANLHAIKGNQLIYSEYLETNRANTYNLATNQKKYYGYGFIEFSDDGQAFYRCASDPTYTGAEIVNQIDQTSGEIKKLCSIPNFSDILTVRQDVIYYGDGNKIYKKAFNQDQEVKLIEGNGYAQMHGSFIYFIARNDNGKSLWLSVRNLDGVEKLKLITPESN